MAREPLSISKLPKKASEMTDEEFDAYTKAEYKAAKDAYLKSQKKGSK